MSVLIAVKTCCCLWCYLPEWTSLHFCQRLKIEKRNGFGAKLYPSQFSTTFELCISIEWISKFALYVSRGARENVWLNASEADASGRRRSFIILCKKNSYDWVNPWNLFGVHSALWSTHELLVPREGLTLKMHASACPHLENIRIMTREVRLWVLGYARDAIWTLESAKKIIHRQHFDRTVGTNSVLLLQLTVARRILE